MNFTAANRYLNSFINFENWMHVARKRSWNLKRMHALVEVFAHPEKAFFPIIIAGTKGKGSTGFFLESILKQAGIPVGFYNSPHLEDPRERIRLNGKMVSKDSWSNELAQIRRKLSSLKSPLLKDCTYFEISSLLAALLFKKQGVKVAIFEVGMGGRFDATRVLGKNMMILTPISLDHQQFLGNTIAAIAGEKAAIIRSRSDVIVGRQPAAALRVIQRQVRQTKSRLWKAVVNGHRPQVLGEHQRQNAALAIRAAKLLREKHGFNITKQAIEKGLLAKHWPGRLEKLGKAPDFYIDAAHNPAAVAALGKSLQKHFPKRDRTLIFGTGKDKNPEAMLKILSRYFDRVIVTRAHNPRSCDIADLMQRARPYFKEIYPAKQSEAALQIAKRLASPKTVTVGTGSFYLIGEIRKKWRSTI